MTAVPKPLYVEQGTTFFLGFNWHKPGSVVNGVVTPGDPYDLTGCEVRMQIRKKRGEAVLVEATTANGRVEVDGPAGRIEVTLTDLDTDALNIRSAYYDLEVVWPLAQGEVRPRVDRLLKGSVQIDPNITQETA